MLYIKLKDCSIGFSNSLITILENKSLQDQKVGTVKKTIAHSPIYETGGAFLGKWAIFGLTQENMHNSLMNEVSLYNIDKKLLNQQWYDENGNLNTKFIDASRMGDNIIDLSQIISSCRFFLADVPGYCPPVFLFGL